MNDNTKLSIHQRFMKRYMTESNMLPSDIELPLDPSDLLQNSLVEAISPGEVWKGSYTHGRRFLAVGTRCGTVVLHEAAKDQVRYVAPEIFYRRASLKGLFQANGEVTEEHLDHLRSIIDAYK